METLQAIFPARDCTLLVAIVLFPLFGAFVNGVFGKRLGKEAVTLMGLVAIGASFIASVGAFLMLYAKQTEEEAARLVWTGWTWVSLSPSGELNAIGQGGGSIPINVDIAFSVDALNGTMALIVTGIGFLIHLYSTKYMEEDPSYHRFFAYLNLFIFSMLVLILGDSLPVMFVGWEGVGLCSYLLIGFWYGEKANAAAGKKAFITNRIGDFGLLVAMALLVRYTGSLSWSGIAAHGQDLLRPITVWQIPMFEGKAGFLGSLGAPVQVTAATLVGLALFLGCAGKSAQIPLYVWLPDAMAGPTPVSALIHAATMVTAGVYLVCRTSAIFVLSPAAMFTVALTGAATAVLAATIALVQNDIKKVLAYSTVSQLGYMFMGVGVGAFTAGFFHVITHAFFKACLFLGAGSVIHAMHARIHDNEASQDIRNMGGLAKSLPITHATFLVSCLAIAGVPPLSGFFSKDEILHNVFVSTVRPPTADGTAYGLTIFTWPTWGGPLLLTAGLLAAVMTAFYMFRLYILTFLGEFRGWKVVANWTEPAGGHGHDAHGHDAHDDHGHDDHGHDAHGHASTEPLEGPTPHESPWQMSLPLIVLGFLALVGGALMHPLERWLEPVFAVARKGVEESDKGGIVMPLALTAAIVGIGAAFYIYKQQNGAPAKQLATQFPALHKLVYEKWHVDEFYDEFFIGTVDFIADCFVWIDKWVVDGIVARFTAWLVAVTGYLLRLLQTGRIQAYAAVMMVGTACLGWFFTMPQAKTHVERDDNSGHYTVSAAPGLGYSYRWDADADGKPDSADFSDKKSVELSLGVGQSRNVELEVKNAFGRVGHETVTLTRPKPDDSRHAELEVPMNGALAGREVVR
ncbi:MAG TPA: NADH-quinone oxidoreductase subunit L [Polyangiaceae bacterium]|jgi:NADH-quinone oxidoreductase subunit L|nr:NADH-quinone oxidoreductase subunit L [Polyangiaceae bacterium]